uniref:Uncharacterized protein n=1 Tax=Anopheles atroparvus TaxID=41427 RepID=A0A182IT57_ANOAO
MQGGIIGSQSRKKNVKRVMVKAYDVIWPLIEGEHYDELCRQLRTVEPQNIVTGCNAVIKLLQNGQAAAFFMLDYALPKPFGKLLIKMARRRNPSVLVAAIPTFPKQYKSSNRLHIMMAIIDKKPEDLSPATKETLRWMKGILVQKKYVTDKELQCKPVPSQAVSRAKREPNKPMTKEEIAKLYILEPAFVHSKAKKNRVDHFKSIDFISFSDKDKRITIKSKPTGPPSKHQLIERTSFKKSANVSKKDNKIPVNRNQGQLKKKQQTGAPPEKQLSNRKASKKINKAQANPKQVQYKKKKEPVASSKKQLFDRKTSNKSTNVPLKVNKAQGNPNQVQHKKKNLKKNLTSK